MMRLTRLLIHGYLRIPYGFRRITRTGPFGRRGGVFVEDTAPEGNALKRALWTNYVRQYHESSCSVASSALSSVTVRDDACSSTWFIF